MTQPVMSVIAVLVTVLGFCAAIVSLLVLAFGAKLPREQGKPQRIKYRNVEITTDRIGMLFVAGLAAMALPLALFTYLTRAGDRCQEQLRSVRQELALIHGEALLLTATVESAPGQPARGFDASVTRLKIGGGESEECPPARLVNGDFTCKIPIGDLRDTFKLRVSRSGSSEVSFTKFTPIEPRVTMTVRDAESPP